MPVEDNGCESILSNGVSRPVFTEALMIELLVNRLVLNAFVLDNRASGTGSFWNMGKLQLERVNLEIARNRRRRSGA